MSNLVHNEQTKMLASALNNLGIISLAKGLIGPFISAFLIPPSTTPFVIDGEKGFIHFPINALGAVAIGSICFVVFVSIAQLMLTQLKE